MVVRVQREVATFDEVSEVTDRAVSGKQFAVKRRPFALLPLESRAKEGEGLPAGWSSLLKYATDGDFRGVGRKSEGCVWARVVKKGGFG